MHKKRNILRYMMCNIIYFIYILFINIKLYRRNRKFKEIDFLEKQKIMDLK